MEFRKSKYYLQIFFCKTKTNIKKCSRKNSNEEKLCVYFNSKIDDAFTEQSSQCINEPIDTTFKSWIKIHVIAPRWKCLWMDLTSTNSTQHVSSPLIPLHGNIVSKKHTRLPSVKKQRIHSNTTAEKHDNSSNGGSRRNSAVCIELCLSEGDREPQPNTH